MNKIYKYRGLEFRISDIARPAEMDIVYFTSGEWAWIKPQNLSYDAFKILWLMKKQDHRHPIVPEKELSEAARLANYYAPKCMELFRGKKENDA